MNEPMEYCTHCEKTLPQAKFDIHLGYCRRNIKKCEECHRPYDINQLEEHQEQFHSFTDCQHCGTRLPSKQILQHLVGCIAKPVACVYCELPIPTDKFDEHRVQCESRTRACELCACPIMNKEYFGHLDVCLGPPFSEQPAPIQNYSNQNLPLNFSALSNFASSFSAFSQQPNESYRAYTRVTTTDPRTGEVTVNEYNSNTSPTRQRRPNNPADNFISRNSALSTSNYSNNIGSNYATSSYGLESGFEQYSESDDPELQAALMASLGFQDQNVALEGQKEGKKK